MLVSADGAERISNVVAERCKAAEVCVPLPRGEVAIEADEVRRQVWNEARRGGQKALAKELKGARFSHVEEPEDLTTRQRTKLACIERTNRPVRAYLLKEQAPAGVCPPRGGGGRLLDAWLRWARRSRLP